MRAGLALMVVLVFASPAQACHRFSMWKYPQAQRCGVQVAENRPPAPPEKPKDVPRFTVSKYDTIILAPEPGRTDEGGRAQAIEILKQVMGQ